jgi:hypothetical protein
MKTLVRYTLLLLVCLSTQVQGQIVDTTRNINSWKLMHNYSRFEDTEMDTSLYDLHLDFNPRNRNGFSYEYLGILGSAAQNHDVLARPGTNSFLFGTSLYPYMADPDRTIFYNTKSPFTELVYSTILGEEWKEETVSFLHTQNMDPFSNIGIDFELLAGKELYPNEETRTTKFTLFGSRAKEKYSAFGTFHFNRFNNRESGGLQNPDAFLQGTEQDLWLYNVNLPAARSSYTRMQAFYTQKFNITEKEYFTDSLGVTTDSGKNFSFNHQFIAERNKRYYDDAFKLDAVPGLYDSLYYFSEEVRDSVVYDKVTNTFQFILGDPYTDQLSARIYAGHELSRYGQRSPEPGLVFSHYDTLSQVPLELDSVFKDTATTMFHNKLFNDVFVGFHLAGPPKRPRYWNVDGRYYLAGYFRNNFSASATFSRQIFNTYRLGLRGNIENRNVSYYHNHYSSAFFKWDNDFRASQLIRGEAFLTNTAQRFNAVISTGVWTNYLYWDENALPAQYDKIIYILSGKIFKHFKISGFNSHNQILVQLSTAEEVLRLPLVAVKTSNYWEQVLFKGALTAQIGIDLYITTPYTGNAYMPATGVFYLQNEATIGGFPFADAFLAVRIKRTRIFTSYNNGLAGIVSNNYFTAAEYPTKPGFFRFGLAWTFYD